MRYLLLVLITLFSSSVFAGGETGNGGVGLICKFAEDSKGKLYFLDSILLRKQKFYTNQYFSDSAKFDEAFLSKLDTSFPSLAASYRNFLRIMEEGKGLFSKNRYIFWQEGEPSYTHDQDVKVRLPEECLPANSELPKYQQIVAMYNLNGSPVQKPGAPDLDQILYIKDPVALKDLSENKDELSWLTIHEWLWNYVESIDKLRLINAYFHSEDFFQAKSIKEVETSLSNLGFRFPVDTVRADSTEKAILKFSRLKFKLFPLLKHLESKKREEIECEIGSKDYDAIHKISLLINFYAEPKSSQMYFAMRFLAENRNYRVAKFLAKEDWDLYTRAYNWTKVCE